MKKSLFCVFLGSDYVQHIFIKKAKKGYDYAFSNSFFVKEGDLNSFPFLETPLQVVENQQDAIYIFFSRVTKSVQLYLKILFDKKLKEVNEISVSFLVNDLIPEMIQEMKKIYRLGIRDNATYFEGQIIMIMGEKAYVLSSDFTISEIHCYFDRLLPVYEWIEKEKNFSSLNDFFYFITRNDVENNISIMHPYFFGNTKEKEILKENERGCTFYLSRKEFIWHF